MQKLSFVYLFCIVLALFCLPVHHVNAIPVDPTEVVYWASELAEEFVARIVSDTTFSEFRDVIEAQTMNVENVDPTERTTALAAAVKVVTDRVMQSANEIADVLRSTANITTPTELPDFIDICEDSVLKYGLEYNSHFKTAVNLSYTGMFMNWWKDFQERDYPQIYREIQQMRMLNDVMVKMGNEDHYSTLQYVGTEHGVYQVFPLQRYNWKSCSKNGTNPYDPRLRPWYVSSTSGPKDLIILIDASDSMKINNRFEKTKKAINTLLSMLAETDFVNVIFFNENAYTSMFNETVVRATTENKQILSDFVNSAETSTGTNFVSGFEMAFNMHLETVKRGMGSNCDRIVIFITDGIASDPSEFIDEHPMKGNVKIFSYAIGRLTDYSVPLKLAEDNGGTFTILSDYTDFSKIVTKYYTHLGRGNALWTAPYYGSSQGQLMMTYCIPVYADDDDPTSEFLGVVGVDLALKVIEDSISSVVLGSANHTYAFMANTEGDVIFHPDFTPNPVLRFFDVEPMETIIKVSDYLQSNRKQTPFNLMVRRPIVSGAWGNYSVVVDENLLPAGIRKVEKTYVFSPVLTTPLSVATVWPTNNIKKMVLPPIPKLPEGGRWDDDRLILCDFEPYKKDKELAPSFNYTTITTPQGKDIDICYNHVGIVLPPGMFCNSSHLVDSYTLAHELSRASSDPNIVFETCDSPEGILKASYLLPVTRILSYLAPKWISIYNSENFSNFYTHIFYADANGMGAIYPAVQSNPFYDCRDSVWYRRAIASSGRFSLSMPYIDSTSGSYPVITMSRAITRDGVIIGVGGADIHLEKLQELLHDISGGDCDSTTTKNPHIQCYIIDSYGYLLHHPTFYLNDLHPEEIRDLIEERFLGEFHAPIVERLLEEGFFIKNEITVPNKICEREDGTEAPCFYKQTYYTVNPTFFDNRTVFDTTIANPCVRGSITMAPVQNSGIYLIVMQGTTATCKYKIVPEMERLSHEYFTQQHYTDRASYACAAEGDARALMCPGENETRFVCNGYGDCIDGVCICHKGDIESPYCDSSSSLRPFLLINLIVCLFFCFFIFF